MCKIKKCNLITLVTVVMLTFFCSTAVYADDTSLGRTPEGVFPMQENDVIMESEEITIDLEKNSVECIFVFHNTGKSKNVFMGFPGKLNHEEDGLTQDVNLQLSHFKTFVKGKELPVTCEKNTHDIDNQTLNMLQYSEYYTFTVPFKADEKITVRNTYIFTPTNDSIGDVFSGYVLKTGAMWKGPIGSAKVTFLLGKIQPYQLEQLYPGGFKFVGNKLIWERSNFEPRYDLQIYYNTYRYSAEDLSNLTDNEDKLKQEIKQKIDSYKKVKELSNKGRTDELLALYNKAVEQGDSVLTAYIRSYLPAEMMPDESFTLGDISIENNYDRYYIKCEVLGPSPAFSQLSISHIVDGIEILDGEFDGSYNFVELTPGTEYNITYTVTDWLNRTEQKTLKYKVPEQAEVSTEKQTQPSDSATASTSSNSNIVPELTNESANKPVSGSVNETADNQTNEPVNGSVNKTADNPANETKNQIVKTQKSNGSDIIVWVLAGVMIIGVIVIAFTRIRKKQR